MKQFWTKQLLLSPGTSIHKFSTITLIVYAKPFTSHSRQLKSSFKQSKKWQKLRNSSSYQSYTTRNQKISTTVLTWLMRKRFCFKLGQWLKKVEAKKGFAKPHLKSHLITSQEISSSMRFASFLFKLRKISQLLFRFKANLVLENLQFLEQSEDSLKIEVLSTR